MCKFITTRTGNMIVGQATFRLPYEPKSYKYMYREELREKLSNLNAKQDEILIATFETSKKEYYDTENILFYNVGTSYFSASSVNGVIMQTKYIDSIDYINIHRYELLNVLGLKKKYLDIFASIEIEQEKVNTSNRVLDYWIASHKGKINVNGSKLPKDGKFGISIKIYQSKKDYNIVNIIKPMVDGLISSLHSEKQIDSESVKRISNLSGVNKHDVEKFLKNPHFAALGERNLVSNYRNGIKWNPQDDLCEYLEIYPVIDRTRNDVLIRAFFFNI